MKHLNRLILTAIVFLFSSQMFATPQAPDYIIYKGDTLPNYHGSRILEEYLQTIDKVERAEEFRHMNCTCCVLGYQAIFSIENDSLFLNDITKCLDKDYNKIDKEESQQKINYIFKDQVRPDGKVFVNWHSGKITLPDGATLRAPYPLYQPSIYEREILLNIEKGKLVKTKKQKNYYDKQNRINRRYNDRLEDLFFNEIQAIDRSEHLDCIYFNLYQITIGTNGKVKSVSPILPQEDNDCSPIIYERLKKLKFDIIKKDGKPREERVDLEIIRDSETGELRLFKAFTKLALE